LVYQVPQLDVNFYRDPGPIFSGQMTTLPIQVINLGRKSVILGNMTAKAENADLSNATTMVGTLDAGGSYTLDANYMPMQPGEQVVTVEVAYTDDFNQPQVITKTIKVTVADAPLPPPPSMGEDGQGPDGGMPPAAQETLWQKVVRFFKGLFGLGSGLDQPSQPAEGMPGQFEDPGMMEGGGGGKIP